MIHFEIFNGTPGNTILQFNDEEGIIYESATLNDNLDHSGGLTIAWNSDSGAPLEVGTSVEYGGLKYSLLDPYTPSKAGPCHWRYEPCFRHPAARLSRVPFFLKMVTSELEDGVTYTDDVQLNTTYFTGYPSTVFAWFTKVFADIGEDDDEFAATFGSCNAGMFNADGTAVSNVDEIGYITVNFDNCSISEAANKVGEALGCNVFFDMQGGGTTIRFVVGNTIQGETYNCFHVLGGTTNMGKVTVNGTYAPVTKRLTLNTDENPNSMIGGPGQGGIRLTKELIFDNIYPKQELFISNVTTRMCWMKDEEGKKILTTQDDPCGVVNESDGLKYKAFSIFYVQLRTETGELYMFDGKFLIEDKPLSILFQPNYSDTVHTSPLAGRQFELAFHKSRTTFQADEERNNDIGTTTIPDNCFEIINSADEGVIMPNFTGMAPAVGNKVTLVNIYLGRPFVQAAQARLAQAAEKVIQMMVHDRGDYSGTVLGNPPAVGGDFAVDGHSGIVTSINANLDTEESQVTVGSWHAKTNLGGMRDKIESISMHGGTPTTTENAPTGTSATSVDLILKTRTNDLGKKVMTFGANLEAVMNQQDKQFQIHFGTGDPTDSETDDPSDEWTTDELKAQHEEDIYYDINRTGSSTGGHAWRWTKFEEGSTLPNGTTAAEDIWMWVVINDTETIAALEKIADVASDEVLCGGMEKQTIKTEFQLALNDYQSYYNGLAVSYGIKQSEEPAVAAVATAVGTTWQALWIILNGGVDDTSAGDKYETLPAFIGSSEALATNTRLADYNITAVQYRNAWNNFYSALGDLIKLIEDINKSDTNTAKTNAAAALKKLSDMADDSKLDPVEKQSVKREFLNLWSEKDKDGGIIDACSINNGAAWRVDYQDYILPYINAFKAIGTLLNGRSAWTAADTRQTDAYRATDSNLPVWIRDANINTTHSLSSSDNWLKLWSDFYAARTAILMELASIAGTKADAAYVAATSSVACYVSDTIPTSYKQGDMWYKTTNGDASNFTLYICIHTLGDGESTQMSHWLAQDIYETGRVDALREKELYSTLGMLLCHHFIETGRNALWIWYGGDHSNGGNQGDIWYIPASGQDSEELYVSTANGGGHWSDYGISQDEYGQEVIDESREQIMYIMQCIHENNKQNEFTIRLVKPTRDDIRVGDIVISQAKFRDAFTGQEMTGEVGISLCTQRRSHVESGNVVYDEDPKVEHLREDTSGVLENYGDHIVAAIYGTSDANIKQMKAAGLTITKNFAQLFAQAADAQTGELKAKAGITVHVEDIDDGEGGTVQQGFVDIEGTFRSADNKVRIEEIEGYPSKRAVIVIGNPESEKTDSGLQEQEVVINRVVNLVNGSTFGQIILNGFYNDEREHNTIINAGGVYTAEFGLILPAGDGEFLHHYGVGTYANPLHFTAYDKDDNPVDVCIVGGIIVPYFEPIDE